MISITEFKWFVGEGAQPELCNGPYDTKEEAVDEGYGYGYESFTVMEAKHAKPWLPDADCIVTAFLDGNDELGDPDGDYFGEDMKPTKEQEQELTDELRQVFSEWLDRHKLWPSVWSFGAMRNEEYIENKEAA